MTPSIQKENNMKLLTSILQLLIIYVKSNNTHTNFKEVENHHYFQQVSKIIGAASFAHMAI